MYIEAVPNRKSPPAILLRESYRENGRVKKRTIANLTKWPETLVADMKSSLAKKKDRNNPMADTIDSFQVGAVFGVLAVLKKLADVVA